MAEWEYRYRARLSFRPNEVSGRDPVAFLLGLPIFWKGSDVTYGLLVDCSVAMGPQFGFAKPYDINAGVLSDLGESTDTGPVPAMAAAPPRVREEAPSSGLRYRYRARMAFKANPVPGLDAFGFLQRVRVFWKGPMGAIAGMRPVACAVALGENYGFAIPLSDYEGDPAELEDLGEGDPLYERPPAYAPAQAPGRPPARPEPPTGFRPGTALYRPPPPPAMPSAGPPGAKPMQPAGPSTPASPGVPPPVPASLAGILAPSSTATPAAPRFDLPTELLRMLDTPAGARFLKTLSETLRPLAAEVSGQALEPVRRSVAVIQKELGDARSDLANISKEVRALKHSGASGYAPVPKPVPRDEYAMTDEEIGAQVVHQLWKQNKWGAVYTSVKNFEKGYNAKVDVARIRRVVKSLTAAGILLRHAKAPDETYSLNPHQKADVARILGVEEESLEFQEPQTIPAAAPPAQPEGAFVPRDSFDHTVRSIRDDLAKMGSSLRTAMEQTAPQHELAALAEKAAALESRLAELQNAITDQAERLGGLISWQQALKEPPSAEPGGA